jgi:hypothetical protein
VTYLDKAKEAIEDAERLKSQSWGLTERALKTAQTYALLAIAESMQPVAAAQELAAMIAAGGTGASPPSNSLLD